MKSKTVKKILLCLSLSLILTSIFRGEAESMSYEEIFNWVVQELKIDKDYPVPQIVTTSKAELQTLFKETSAKSYQRWVRELGENEAEKAMDRYLKEIIGLFDPKNKVIYVGNFMDPCKFNSIVAHEICHYLQVMEEGTVDPPQIGFANVHLFREMQASKIENEYKETFCILPDTGAVTVSKN